MGGSRLLNTNTPLNSSHHPSKGPQSIPNDTDQQNQNGLTSSSHREDDSGNGSQGSDSFHSQNHTSHLSNIHKNNKTSSAKSSGKGIGGLIQRTFFRKGSRPKNNNKLSKNDSSNGKGDAFSGSVRLNKSQPKAYGGHFNGGGSISSRRRASQKRRRRLSNARRATKNQDHKGKLLTKADIGQPIPMDEEEKQIIISAKQWPANLKSSGHRSSNGNYRYHNKPRYHQFYIFP